MREKLIGSWALRDHRRHEKNGDVHPTSSYLKGRIIYTACGHMSVVIVVKEQVESVKDMIVYSGRFTLEQDKVLHHIDVSPQFHRVNKTEERYFQLDGDILTLKTPDLGNGFYVIEWARES